MDSFKLAEILGKRWSILNELYNGGLSTRELAFRLKKPLPWISSQLKELRSDEMGLVLVTEDSKGTKHYTLTERGRKLCSAILEASKPLTKRVKVSSSDIDLQIRALEDKVQSYGVREAASHGLLRYCSQDHEIDDGREQLRAFFIRAIKRIDEYVGDGLVQVPTACGYYLSYHLTKDEIEWLRSVCYPAAISAFERGTVSKVRLAALEVLHSVYRRCAEGGWSIDLVDSLARVFEGTFFKPDEDKSVAERCWEILRLGEHGKGWQRFIDRIYEEAKSRENDERIRNRCQNYLIKALQPLS